MLTTLIFVFLSSAKLGELLWAVVAQMAYCALTGAYSLCYDLCNNPPCLNMQRVTDSSYYILYNLMFH